HRSRRFRYATADAGADWTRCKYTRHVGEERRCSMSIAPTSLDLRSRIVHLHTLEMSNEAIAAFVELSPDEVARLLFDDWMEQRREQVRLAAMSKPEPAPAPRQLKREHRRQEVRQRVAERTAKQTAKQAAIDAALAVAEERRRKVREGFGCPTPEQIA